MLKIDVENAEWPFLRQFLHTAWPGQIKQMAVEVHTPRMKRDEMTVDMYAAIFHDLTMLQQKHGYRMYKTRHDNKCCARFTEITPAKMIGPWALCCYELYYVNTNIEHKN